MDYCSTCRRHLNGALVCPGCGAYAPDIAPQIIAAPSAAPAPLNSLSSPGSPDSSDSPDSPGLESVTPPVPLPAPQGRAARRRQLARWKKNQRRAVVATAVALVGGGLTVASLDRGTGDQTQAATAPELPTTSNDEQPTSDHTRPTVTRSNAHRSTPSSTLPSQPQSRANTHPDSLASTPKPPTNSTRTSSVPHQRTGTSSYNGTVSTTTTSTGTTGTTGTTAQQSPAPPTTGGTESSTSTGSTSTGSTSTGSTNPAPAATSPSNICVLGLICL